MGRTVGNEETDQNPIVAWIQSHLIASAFIAMALVIIVGLFLGSLGGSDDPEAAPAESTTTTDPGPDSQTDDPNRPEVPQVDCRTLLTNDEVDLALFGDGELDGPRGFFTFAQGETCLHEADDDTDSYIQIEPGDPTDLEESAQLSGVFGVTVAGVGDAANWFDDGSDLGILSVGVDLGEASIVYRVHVGRSDLTDSGRLAAAQELALAALPRFPGTAPGPPEPLVDLCELVSDERADEILSAYRDAHPATRDELLATDNFSGPVDLTEEGDAKCTKLILAEIYIESQQGSLSDFESGATMEGVSGEAISGLGEEAVWFAAVPHQGSFTAPHERGVFSVRFGDATFRIIVAVPDTPADEVLGIARGLAAGALGVVPGAPQPDQGVEVVTFDEEPPDLPPQSLHAVVYEGVEGGEWSEGEGLVAALTWILDPSTGFVAVELSDRSYTTTINAGLAYAASAANDAPQVQLLVDELLESPDVTGVLDEDAAGSGLLVSAAPLAQEETVPSCPEGICVSAYLEDLPEYTGSAIEPGKYSVFVIGTDHGEDFDSLAIDGFHDAVVMFEQPGLGGMVRATLHLSPGQGSFGVYDSSKDLCVVNIGQNQANLPADELFQLAATETARCFVNFDLFLQLHQNPNPWLEEGLATYLGGIVLANNNAEHKALPGLLASSELHSSMLERARSNWAFFESLHSQLGGAEAVMNLMRALPEDGDLANGLASVPNISVLYSRFGQALSGSGLSDVGGGNVPYGPESWQVILSSPKKFDSSLSQFTTRRYRLEVPSGRYACDVSVTSDGAEVSWKSGPPGTPGEWSDVPGTLEGTSVLLVTSVQDDTGFNFEAGKVGDNPDCEEEEDEPFDPSQGDLLGPIEDLCDAICDPSTYYWGPLDL